MTSFPPQGSSGGAAFDNTGSGVAGAGSESTLYGESAVASGDFTVAVGHTATADSDYNTVVGNDADGGGGTLNTVVGFNATSNTTAATGVAVGANTQLTGSTGVAVGYAAQATSTGGVAVGSSAMASAAAVAVGLSADATTTGAIAIGDNTQATVTNSVAIGDGTAATTGAQPTAVGAAASATGDNSVALGKSATASTTNTIAVGVSATASGVDCMAFGTDATNSTANTCLIGGTSGQIDQIDITHQTRGRENVLTGTWRTVVILERSTTSPTSIANATNTALDWDTETLDERGWVDLGTNDDRVTFDGSYTVRVTLDDVFGASPVEWGVWVVQLASGGTPTSSSPIEETTFVLRGVLPPPAIFDVSNNDFIYVEAQQASGGNLNWPNSGTGVKVPRLVVEILQ